MSDQDNGKITTATTTQRPTTDDPKAWKAYWESQDQPWRTEPEIDAERQKYLTERRAIVPDIEKGIYPFKDIKLGRADIEWLITTNENKQISRGWDDKDKQVSKGLDLRGAVLQKADLHSLPLAFLHGGLTREEARRVTIKQGIRAAINLTEANLRDARLEHAHLLLAQLDRASLVRACLNNADLARSQLKGANCFMAQLNGADLRWSNLNNASLVKAELKGSDLGWTHLDGAELSSISWSGENYVGPFLADVYWGDINLTVIDWSQIKILGNEHEANQDKDKSGKAKDGATRLKELSSAIRVNRQLTVVLKSQGLDANAEHFAYRNQILQRRISWKQRAFGQWLFSLLLAGLAGYGYRPGRSALWYLATIIGFALGYHFLGGLSLYPPDALIFSIMSFHGRGFFPSLSQETSLHNPLVMLAAVEAIIGLLIEISFIATFTQRFFGK